MSENEHKEEIASHEQPQPTVAELQEKYAKLQVQYLAQQGDIKILKGQVEQLFNWWHNRQ